MFALQRTSSLGQLEWPRASRREHAGHEQQHLASSEPASVSPFGSNRGGGGGLAGCCPRSRASRGLLGHDHDLIIMQSTLGAALAVSEQRFAGTALGAVMGALLTTYFGSNLIVFGLGVFVIGLVCAALRLEDAYRLASVYLGDCHALCPHQTSVDSCGSPVHRSLGRNRSRFGADCLMAGGRTEGKSRVAWFPLGIGSVNYFAGAAAAACSRSTSLRRAALPRSARK
jgi:hypothetical protein